jgi:outer membrane protein insertion porin family
MYRSLGVGLRIHMPMFGLLGVDWGYGLDAIPGDPTASGSHFHISINNSID